MADVKYDTDSLQQLMASDSDDNNNFEGFEEDEIIGAGEVLMELPMSDFKPGIDVKLESDVYAGWTTIDSMPAIPSFTGTSKLNVEMVTTEPMDYLKLFFDDDLLHLIVEQTNCYADQRVHGTDLKENSRMKKWQPVTLEQLKIFFALIIAMGLVQKSDIDSYWATDDVISTPYFSKKMSRDRFLAILSNLHMADNENNQGDPLHLIRPMIEKNEAFSEVYSPDMNLRFDQAICPWKGRFTFRVHNPANPNKFGIKLFQVCEASSGYCIGYHIYAGKSGGDLDSYCEGLELNTDQLTKTTKIVIGLLCKCSLLNKGHRVYMDSRYSSPELFNELELLNTSACGTLRTNRIGVAEAVKVKTKLNQGECIFRRKDNLLLVKYHDKQDVNMISSFHEAKVAVINKTNFSTNTPVKKPTCIVDYVKNMRGLDLSSKYNPVIRKSKKWWRKLFFHLLNVCIVNAYQLHLKFSPVQKKLSHHDFCVSVVKSLVQEAGDVSEPTRRGHKFAGEQTERLFGRHFPEFIPATPGARRAHPARDCVACNKRKKDRKGFKRKQTSFRCETCQVALCVPDCFKLFHTHANYKQNDCSCSDELE